MAAPCNQGRIQDFGLGGALAGGSGLEDGRLSPSGLEVEHRCPVEAPEARRMLRHDAKNTDREKKQVHTD